MTEHIKHAALGKEDTFPWKGRLNPYVESVVIFMWCHRLFTLGEVIAVALIALGLGGWWF